MNTKEYLETLTGRGHKFCICGHISRDHDRTHKKNGHWTGKCNMPDCDCREYQVAKKK